MIDLRNISLQIGSHQMRDVSLKIETGEVHVLLGPSGAGKTLLLESVVGLQQAQHGQIFIDGVDVTARPPEQRNIGYIPQDGSLFPHLSVRDNILFGRKVRRALAGADADLQQLAEILGLSHELLARRSVASLSGGEQQRVALARALITSPTVLLLDESFSALDADVRTQLLFALRRLQKQRKQTIMYVTHHQDDAELIADNVSVMMAGALVQTSNSEQLWQRPASLAVATFLQLENIFPCAPQISETDSRAVTVLGCSLPLPPHFNASKPAGAALTHVSLRAEQLQVAPAASDHAEFAGNVERIGFHQRNARAWIRLDEHVIECGLSSWQAANAGTLPAVGARVSITVPAHAIIPIFGPTFGSVT
jgi:ABC-type Fe3+/spermidine/putrescine transport system ATPase subunit